MCRVRESTSRGALTLRKDDDSTCRGDSKDRNPGQNERFSLSYTKVDEDELREINKIFNNEAEI